MWQGLVPATPSQKTMGGLYKPRTNEIAYVSKTEEFTTYTTFLMLNMPEEWKEFLTTPVTHTAFNIETCVEKANAVYIPKPDNEPERFVKAIRERTAFLYDALRLFRDFDQKMERLLGQIDLLQSEKRRLKNIVLSLIEDAKRSDEEVPEIKIITRCNDFEYKSANGSHVFRLKLTSKQKDHLLKLEHEAKTAIKNRIEKDNYMLSSNRNTGQ